MTSDAGPIPEQSPPVSRRSFLTGGGATLGGLLLPMATAVPAAAGSRAQLTAVNMGSLHVHACFSEGYGSMESNLEQAREYGADVVWWTEHDFRMTTKLFYRQSLGFEGPVEGSGNDEWRWEKSLDGDPEVAEDSYVTSPHSPDEAGKALRLTTRGESSDFTGLWLTGMAWNSTYTTCLADTTLELDVRPESLGDDSLLGVEILSSHHPAVSDRPAGQYRLRYLLGSTTGQRQSGPDPNNPLLGVVTLPEDAGTEIGDGWRRLQLTPVDDIATCWPDMVAGDNSLYRLRVGALSRQGQTARIVIDRLRFHRKRRDGDQSVQMQRELIRAYADRYPDIRQYPSAEISLVRHMNWFGGDFQLPDYPSYYDPSQFKDESLAATRQAVEHIHAAGGLAQRNHPGGGPDLAKEIPELGCDLVEIGRDPTDDYVYGWDVACRTAVFVTATASNDAHNGSWGRPWPWMTSVWARSTDRKDLVAALRAGRAWMTDPDRWRGQLDLSVAGQSAMGSVVVSDSPTVQIRATATDIPSEGSLQIVEGSIDPGSKAREPNIRTYSLPGSLLPDGSLHLGIRAGARRYFRLAVRDADDEIVGLSNPIWLLPPDTPVEVPPARRLSLGPLPLERRADV